FNPETKTGTGVTFQSYNAYDMLDAIKRTLSLYSDKGMWRILRKNAMSKDFSWKKSAKEYVGVYEEVLR
ncbi:MAG: starch synthase, partial [Clostridia bacterium]|nr:starch synthase [Clostridia bacterium]